MTKRCYRYFGGLLSAQERWLNRMAARGWRLGEAGKLAYEFESCQPGQFQYCVEFVGEKSPMDAEDYRTFLEDLGYRIFFKNINLNYSVGKVRWRPWAEPGGQIATKETTFDRELLIVEKEADGEEFQLHTSFEDRANYFRRVQKPWLSIVLLCGILAAVCREPGLGVLAAMALVPVLLYQVQITKNRRQAQSQEW